METVSGELTDFCLVLVPNADATTRASHAVRSRFTFLAEETRMKLVTAVADRVARALPRGSGRPIAVSIALESDAIYGEVSDQEEPGAGSGARFEISLP